MTVHLINHPDQRDQIIDLLKSSTAIVDFAPTTGGRLPVSYGDPERGYISVDHEGIRRFYDRVVLVHEERVKPGDVDPVTNAPIPALAGEGDSFDLIEAQEDEAADAIIEENADIWPW